MVQGKEQQNNKSKFFLMKKFLIVSLSLMMITAVNAQSSKYEPYVGIGASLSSGTIGEGAEIGMYNEKTWFAFTVNTVELVDQREWYGGVKVYYRLGHSGIIDTYGYGGVNVHLEKDKALSFEPGIAVVLNISNRLAPQFTLGIPIQENTNSAFKPLPLSFGVGLNFWLY
jgi:hypothetical protein